MTALTINPHNLRRLRLERALTQAELAQAAGIHAISLSRIETGLVQPNIRTIRKLAKALNVKPQDIATVI